MQSPEGCSTQPRDCPICGCQLEYDEAGNVIGMVSDEMQDACFDPNTQTSAAVSYAMDVATGGPSSCDGQSIRYDGNDRLTCAVDYYQARDRDENDPHLIRYDLTYDARGRMLTYSVSAYEGQPFDDPVVTNPASPYPYVYVYPRHQVTREYSDTTGEYRTLYFRDLHCKDYPCTPDPQHREIETVYQTDAAGRITSVTRDNKETIYTYQDTEPHVTETRPDQSRTEVYLNLDGSIKKIAHWSDGEYIAVFEYVRDGKGRVIQVTEAVKDASAADGVRNEVVEYVYGDGNLTLADLDTPQDANNPHVIPEAGKLYYSFLADLDLGGGFALSDSDPNRLVSERRHVTDDDDGTPGTQYHRAYRYDPGGNRLVMMEFDPVSGQTLAVTRYNYYYPFLAGVSTPHTPHYRPGTPIVRDTPAMDYAGRGRDKLLSSQAHYPNDPDRMHVVLFGYADQPDTPNAISAVDDDSMTSRTETTWLRRPVTDSPGTFAWFKGWERNTIYDYFNGQMEWLVSATDDYCAIGGCETCSPEGGFACTTDPATTFRHEFHNFDMFGRRVNRTVCDKPCVFGGDPEAACSDLTQLFRRCKMDHTQYDFDGLSNTVLVERRGPYEQDINDPENPNVPFDDPYPSYFVGDRFLASYTYGPLGPISRTAEYDDADLTNNRDYYYLRDASGGHVGVAFDHDSDITTAAEPAFAVYDAFGNNMTKPLSGVGAFAWRGGEGSVSDREPNLVHMQARHYDPTLGRFIQADTMMLASMTTQGMNRYIYTENDPVNGSDASGRNPVLLAIGVVLFAAFIGGLLNASTDGFTSWKSFGIGALGGATAAGLGLLGPLGAIGGSALANFAVGYLNGDEWDDIILSTGLGAILGIFGVWLSGLPLHPSDILERIIAALLGLNAELWTECILRLRGALADGGMPRATYANASIRSALFAPVVSLAVTKWLCSRRDAAALEA
jgi:RHS repeat-associated protein